MLTAAEYMSVILILLFCEFFSSSFRIYVHLSHEWNSILIRLVEQGKKCNFETFEFNLFSACHILIQPLRACSGMYNSHWTNNTFQMKRKFPFWLDDRCYLFMSVVDWGHAQYKSSTAKNGIRPTNPTDQLTVFISNPSQRIT